MAKTMTRAFGPPLGEKQQKKLAELRVIVAAKKPRKPVSLAAFRDLHDLSYDDLALLIGAASRGHAWHLCKGDLHPKWPYCKWIVEQLDGAVTVETIMDAGK